MAVCLHEAIERPRVARTSCALAHEHRPHKLGPASSRHKLASHKQPTPAAVIRPCQGGHDVPTREALMRHTLLCTQPTPRSPLAVSVPGSCPQNSRPCPYLAARPLHSCVGSWRLLCSPTLSQPSQLAQCGRALSSHHGS
eukprot:357115-Chlamydomonas_euryale.AAC.2